MATSVAEVARSFKPSVHLMGSEYIPGAYMDSRDTHVPDIIEFVLSDKYLNKPSLYPRQATLLKTIFLQDELYCADEQTEILTQRGWLTYDQVIVGDMVMALDHQTGKARWVRATRINVFPVDGVELEHRQSVNHSSVTTLDHRWPIERYEQGDGVARWERQWRTTAELRGRDRVQCAAPVENLPKSAVYLDEFVELVGWYWTEGHLKGGHAGVTIVQSQDVNPGNCERIETILTKLFGPPLENLQWDDDPAWTSSIARGMRVFRLNRAASDPLVLAASGIEKIIDPAFLIALTQEQLGLLIDTSIAADGYSKNGCRGISQASRGRLSSFQMACSLAGIRTSLRERQIGGTGRYSGRIRYELSLQERRPYKSFQRDRVERIKHSGVVWCPTTELGTWLARREGHVYFTGNTDYDFDVLAEWAEGFQLPDIRTIRSVDGEDLITVHYQGDWGINPDVLDRIKLLKAQGNRWFNVVCAVQGRRSGKGHIGAICGAYVLWNHICAGDPKAAFGIDPSKALAMQVFAGKKQQARDNQWRDIANTVLGGPCFDQFVSESLGESMHVLAPYDRMRALEMVNRMSESESLLSDSLLDLSTFEITPKEATTMAPRGPASFATFFDEMAHMVATGVSRSASEVWNAADPSLAQFKQLAFSYCGSSPWTMIGKFYELVHESLEVSAQTFEPVNPTILTVQLASWDIYLDWERTANNDMIAAPRRQRVYGKDADGRPIYKTIPTTYFPPLRGGIYEYNAKAQREERLNPDTFRVEYRAKWAVAQDSYLPAEHVDRIFRPWNGIALIQLDQGSPGVHDYYAHGDPGKVGSNFGFAIAHAVPDPEGSGIPHVVFDRVHAWTPGDFPHLTDNGDITYEMSYTEVEKDIKEWATGFQFTDLSFDQWNSISLVERLSSHLGVVAYKPTMVWERTATAPLNWATAETFKLALALDRVHAPYLELAEMECKFLRKMPGDKVDHPTVGPCTTKDVYDAMSIVVHKLIGSHIAAAYGEQFSALRVGTGMPGAVAAQRSEGVTRGGPPLADAAVQKLFNQDRRGSSATRRSNRGAGTQRPRPEKGR